MLQDEIVRRGRETPRRIPRDGMRGIDLFNHGARFRPSVTTPVIGAGAFHLAHLHLSYRRLRCRVCAVSLSFALQFTAMSFCPLLEGQTR